MSDCALIKKLKPLPLMSVGAARNFKRSRATSNAANVWLSRTCGPYSNVSMAPYKLLEAWMRTTSVLSPPYLARCRRKQFTTCCLRAPGPAPRLPGLPLWLTWCGLRHPRDPSAGLVSSRPKGSKNKPEAATAGSTAAQPNAGKRGGGRPRAAA